jgi:hypothetical protein
MARHKICPYTRRRVIGAIARRIYAQYPQNQQKKKKEAKKKKITATIDSLNEEKTY